VVAAVVPTEAAGVRLRPADARGVRVEKGFWDERLRLNRERTLPHGAAELERCGNLDNFRAAAAGAGAYRGRSDDSGTTFPFLDSDVYKWLEAIGWELSRAPDEELAASAGRMIELVAAAQQPDGYLNTYVQLAAPGAEFADLPWGHELYCIGHLIQAAVAWTRALGDDRLLAIARRAADLVEREFGPGGRVGVDGHPEIEPALVELYRLTGAERYLELARRFVDARGRGILGPGRFGPAYWQDHDLVRAAPSVAGHAVRQLYLDCGAVDVAVESGDRELLDAVVRRWDDMVATRTYLTGAVGSRHRGESFGEQYELPPDRAYAETCAAIASVMLAWRLLLATGESRFADLIERTAFNAVLPGLAFEGSHFFYTNPLQRRTGGGALSAGAETVEREPWFGCACCPPNLMRLLSGLEQQLATVDEHGVQIHQYAAASIGVADRGIGLVLATDYPWSGSVEVRVTESPEKPWRLSLRIPGWCRAASLAVNGVEQPAPSGGRAHVERSWRSGDKVELRLEMPVRVTLPHARIDAVRGCAALERGPLVYCLEQADMPAGVAVEDLALEPVPTPRVVEAPELGRGVHALKVSVRRHTERTPRWPYRDSTEPIAQPDSDGRTDVAAIPYFAWGNRSPGGMRVWVPLQVAREEPEE
jgi:DUF1680 family protein